MSDLQQELERQHAWVDQALTDLACAAEMDESPELQARWSELESRLLGHLEFEESELFPLVEPFHAQALAALREEHDRIRRLLTDLGVRVDLHTLRKEVVDALVETLRRHAEHEDRTLHRWIETNAPEDTRRHLLGLLVKTVRADVRSTQSVGSARDVPH